tara:strand:+ start:562 stop:750 length:189 start_codon:yes stop_codon:yes gene_type:complete
MFIGDLVKYKSKPTLGYVPGGESRQIGIIVAERKMYGHHTKIVLWNDGSTNMEDETTIEVLK